MATSTDYIEYVCEQLRNRDARYRKMFGEYMVYVHDKPVFIVCDNTVYVKELECIQALMEHAEKGFPYEGAKECYIVDIDDQELLEKLVPVLEDVIPVPVKRNRKKTPEKDSNA